MVSYKIDLVGTILTTSTMPQGDIDDFEYQEEDEC